MYGRVGKLVKNYFNIMVKHLKVLIISIAFILPTSVVSNPKDSTFNATLYQSFKTGNMSVWLLVLKELELDYKQKPSSDKLFKIVEVQYGYIGYLLGIENTKQAREFLSKADENIDRIIELQPKNADAVAYKSALTAYHISLSPYKAPFLGPRSMRLIDQALAINPESVQANIEKGNALHYAPSMFGGNPSDAVNYYSKAIGLFEKLNQGNPPNSWLYLNTLVQLALAYEKANQIEKARSVYRRILSQSNDFKWVKDELYPKFQRKHS